MASERVKCVICDNMILSATAEANEGLCAQCVKIPPSKHKIKAAVLAEANPLGRAIELYLSLIDSLVDQSAGRNFGAIADPQFEAVRFYTLETVGEAFYFDEAKELGADAVDEIEHYLNAADPGYSLLLPIEAKMRSVSAAFNATGKTVFLGSWGMGPGEIGWRIRRINDRDTLDRYLHSAGITEDVIDAYNESCGHSRSSE
ncbi:MAG: hypothetical protein ACAI35_26525 [Candidatus Methylacidiphilales bacterium]|nr:hypothetical protein [Candidatus Methylacidiphilales bacterium]